MLPRILLCLLLGVGLLAACEPEAAPTAIKPSATATATPTPRIGVPFVTQPPPTVALVQITPSPLPTATPTPTATPIVYTIVAGDTLLALALTHNTTLEEILALNPGVQPELLQIGQQIILPPPAPPVFGDSGRSTPIPIQVAVLSVSQYRTPTGSFWLMGEVENRGGLPVENVQVALTLFADDGAPTLTVAAWVLPGIIPAGARAPFAVQVNRPDLSPQPPQVAVTAGATVLDFGSRYLDLVPVDVTADYDENQLRLTGTIRNDGAATVAAVDVVSTLYGADGRVVGLQQLTLTEPLPPGGTLPFSLLGVPPGGVPADYAVLLQGWVTAE